ncbi:poly(ethylene terephthalate) hydrolase family protein [Anaerosporobacter sp.]
MKIYGGFQKMKNLMHRLITKLKVIWKIFHSYWNRNFGDTYKGLAICSVLFSSIGMAGAVLMYFTPLSIEISYLIGIVVTIVVFGVLFLGAKILFGNRRKGIIYWCLPFVLFYEIAIEATQGNGSEANFFLAVITIVMLDLFGRSLWAIIKLRRQTITLFITLVITTIGLVSVGTLLTGEGFEDRYIENFLTMKEEKTLEDNQNVADEAFVDAIAQGEVEVASLEYGVGDSFDLQSNTYNLSLFAQRDSSLSGWVMDKYFDYDLKNAPITGKVWYPTTEKDCPVLFIVHGNHNYTTDSYLGYDYLGKYLASNGYVVVSVNENSCNQLGNENDGRAILLLENIKQVLKYNKDKTNPLYQKIDEENIAIAGHSRGGECVSTAYLFNGYDVYPDNGNIKFNYNFSIKSIIAIAPTADQYMPAQHEVSISDVNYLLIHGTNGYGK